MEHRLRDEARSPETIFARTNLAEGDRVLDVGSGSGYLALIAADLVGESGRVVIHNTPGWIAQFPGMDPDRLAAVHQHANLEYLVAPWNEIEGEPESYDVILLGQVYHDVLLEGADLSRFNRQLYMLLKAGGVIVIEDHEADPQMPLVRQVGLHRLGSDFGRRQLTELGYVEIETTFITSEHDDLRFNVFRPGIRGRTSRYVLTARKPD